MLFFIAGDFPKHLLPFPELKKNSKTLHHCTFQVNSTSSSKLESYNNGFYGVRGNDFSDQRIFCND